MKRTLLILGLLTITFLSGCNSSSKNDTNDTAHTYPPVKESQKSVTIPLVKESDFQ